MKIVFLADIVSVNDMNPEILLDGSWQRILNIKRFGTRNMVSAISVAEHSWLVAMLSMMICDNIVHFCKDISYDKEIYVRVLEKSILHDIEECFLGDIPFETFTRPIIKEAKDKLGPHILDVLFEEPQYSRYKKIWKDSKDGITGLIIKYSDMLSVLVESIREIRVGSNNLNDVVVRCLDLLDDIVSIEFIENRNYSIDEKQTFATTKDFLIKLNKSLRKYVKENYDL